jgi:hypothetical protein
MSTTPTTLGSSLPIPVTTSIADTGANDHLFSLTANLLNICAAVSPKPVTLPNSTIIWSTHAGELNIPSISLASHTAHMFPDIAESLLSIGLLCDAGCVATFTKTDVTINHDGTTLLTGHRSSVTKLWTSSLPSYGSLSDQATTDTFANAAQLSATLAELVAFGHAALGSPALSKLLTAINKGFLTGLLGLTSQRVRKYPPNYIATARGHLNQSRQSQRSTKIKQTPDSTPTVDDGFPFLIKHGERIYSCYANCVEATGKVFTNQTGQFVAPSSKGSNYLLIMYVYDADYIHAAPMNNHQEEEILAVYQRAHNLMAAVGFRPKLQRLDNECSKLLKEYMVEEGVDY